jgi:hypothetical protein
MDNAYSFIERYAENAELLNTHPELVDALRYQISGRFYLYGKQYRNNFDSHSFRLKASVLWTLYGLLSKFRAPSIDPSKKNIMSNSYFNLNQIFESDYGYIAYWPTWQPGNINRYIYSSSIFSLTKSISDTVAFAKIEDVFSEFFFKCLSEYRTALLGLIENKNFRAGFFPSDNALFNNLAVNCFKSLNRPTFLASHGFPGVMYTSNDEQRTDYLLVFGEAIKDLYIAAGYRKESIVITGHPVYSTKLPPDNLRCSYDNVLVLTKSGNGAIFSHEALAIDHRSLQIEYLLSIQKILKRVGVRTARLRAHPGESGEWYTEHLFSNFYKLDQQPLSQSLARSTLVIGCSSSMLFDSTYAGVSYTVYEPDLSRGIYRRNPLIPPFDGSMPQVPCAFDEDQLEKILRDRKALDPKVCKSFVADKFDLKEVVERIESRAP